jgi:predicted DNA-binding ribbon-helix-helix protein
MIARRQPMKSVKLKRTVNLAGHKTCVSVENEFWEGLVETAKERGVSPSKLVTSINANRRHGNLSSAVRLFVLNHYRDRAILNRAK